jgi:hypothetical protein
MLRSQSAERKNTEEQSSKPIHPRGERRTEYPGFYMIEGEFNQEEFDRKTLRFKTKNKLLFDEATNNLNECIRLLENGDMK